MTYAVDDAELEADAKRFDRAAFSARHPYVFVSFDAPEEEEDHQIMTAMGEPPATRPEVLVAAIAKRAGSPFQDRISVGRARNSDVVIRHPSVSKLHAHFRKEGPSGLTLTDVGSHNGTKVEGVAIVPHRSEVVRAGTALAIGQVQVRVLDAAGAYDLLRRRP